MQAELYTTPAVFNTLADEWDTVLDPARSNLFFMRHDWQHLWWKHLGRGALSVVTIRDDANTLKSIAPWFIVEENGRRSLHVVGCMDVSDYIDLLLAPGYEDQALSELLNFTLSDNMPIWDEMHLCNIPESSPLMTLLPPLASQRDLVIETSVEDVCPIIMLPDTYESYLEQLDKKQRHELRRKRRRAEGHSVGWYIAGREHELDNKIETFLDLMAMSTPQKNNFLNQPGHRNFFIEMGRTLFDKGMLEINFLTVSEHPVAALWNFAYQDHLMLYNSGLNPTDYSNISAGIVLLALSIEDAIKRGFQKFDFLQGDEEYKYRMGAKTTTVHNLVVKR